MIDSVFAMVLLLNGTSVFSFIAPHLGLQVATVSFILLLLNCLYLVYRLKYTLGLMTGPGIRQWLIVLLMWPLATMVYAPSIDATRASAPDLCLNPSLRCCSLCCNERPACSTPSYGTEFPNLRRRDGPKHDTTRSLRGCGPTDGEANRGDGETVRLLYGAEPIGAQLAVLIHRLVLILEAKA
jgi:hypothetical protein